MATKSRRSSAKAKKKVKRTARERPDEPEIVTTYTEADIRRVHELIEQHGWHHLLIAALGAVPSTER